MAWAEFVDKNGDINDPKNYIQGPQSNKPNGHQVGEYWLQNHPNWLEVDDGFRPPEPVPTKTEQITALNAEYNPQRDGLKQNLSYTNAYYLGNVTKYNSAKAKLDVLNAEYITKLGVINNG